MTASVYFIRACFRTRFHKTNVGFVQWKIGRTFNVERRLRTFQTACPVTLELFGTLACPDVAASAIIERALHQHFADCRIRGEWFTLSAKQTKAVWVLLKAWPIRQPIAQFLDSVPSSAQCESDLLPVKNELVPIAALHEARTTVKRLRAKLVDAKSVVDSLTGLNNDLIKATSALPLATVRQILPGSAPANIDSM